MAIKQQEYTLSLEAVDQIADAIQAFLLERRVERRNALRLRLAMEEILLRLLDAPEPPETVTLGMGKRFGRLGVQLSYGGPAFDPTRGGEGDGDWSGRILANLGMSPVWGRRGGVNTVQLRPPRAGGRSRLFYLAVAVVFAAALGALGGVLPDTLKDTVDRMVLTPVFDAFLGLINTFAGLMVFFAVSTGVFGIGDTASLGRIGKIMFSRFLLFCFAIAAMALALARPFVRLVSASPAGGASQMARIAELMSNILPNNPVIPFLEANIVEIIVLAVFTGITLLILGERVRHVATLAEELSTTVQMMMEYVCKLIPLFVFVSLLRQIWSGALQQLLGLWKPFCMILALDLLVVLVMVLLTSLRAKCRPLPLLRKATPAFVIALTTASSMASYTVAKEKCERKMGISPRLFDFVFPVGIVTYMPAAVVTFCVLALYFAQEFRVETGFAWFFTAGLLATVLSIACPPTPGAMITCYGILLAQLDIPMDALVLAITLDVVLDFVMTGLDVLIIELELVCEADILHMLNHNTLRKAD